MDFSSRNYVTINEWVKENSLSMEKLSDGLNWNTKFVYILWGLWRARNDVVFNNLNMIAREVTIMASQLVKEADNVLCKHAIFRGGRSDWISWTPPDEGWGKLNTDGAKKSNTGHGHCGRAHTGPQREVDKRIHG